MLYVCKYILRIVYSLLSDVKNSLKDQVQRSRVKSILKLRTSGGCINCLNNFTQFLFNFGIGYSCSLVKFSLKENNENTAFTSAP